MESVAKGIKNHEYRKYFLPQTLKGVWLNIVVPIPAFQDVAQISHGNKRGEVAEHEGVGNEDFHDGLKKGNFGYDVQAL